VTLGVAGCSIGWLAGLASEPLDAAIPAEVVSALVVAVIVIVGVAIVALFAGIDDAVTAGLRHKAQDQSKGTSLCGAKEAIDHNKEWRRVLYVQ
jgi:NhaP-type Na+/H+ or K+/H+ antiporter